MRPGGAGDDDESLLARATAEHRSLLGVVRWDDAGQQATLHFVRPAEGQWNDRRIEFEPSDAPAERGRTVGFALASMVPEDVARATSPPRPGPPETSQPLSPAPDGPHEQPRPARRAGPLAESSFITLDACASVTSGIDGFGGGAGGVLGARLRLGGAFRLRLAAGLRAGSIAPAQATTRLLSGAVGLAWQPWLDASRRWSAGARIDVLLLHQEVSHLSADDIEPARLGRLVPGASVAAEAAYRLGDQVALVIAAGPEVAFGRLDVVVHDHHVASLAPVSVFVEGGLRVSF
ncbi:hypothetical protein AKJ09_08942 [Labilithrix luteola]|uniref:Uncharacterized protein n=1 Tax=Labilithrix luteola TaxID=1391654 RepID=A0A0K1Q969_9BACT|nr:hypothetical protein AKJ09_08942 [Labilithrix luteola]